MASKVEIYNLELKEIVLLIEALRAHATALELRSRELRDSVTTASSARVVTTKAEFAYRVLTLLNRATSVTVAVEVDAVEVPNA